MTTDWQKVHRATQASADIVDAQVRWRIQRYAPPDIVYDDETLASLSEWTEADRARAEAIRVEILRVHPHNVTPLDATGSGC